MKILCIHGVGQHLSNGTWQTDWRNALTAAVQNAGGPALKPGDIEFSLLDSLFERYPLSTSQWAEATALLAESGIVHGIGDIWHTARGWLDTLGSRVRWTAGMVVQWVSEAGLRRDLRNLVLGDIKR